MKKVLAIEDELYMLKLYQETLGRSVFEVFTASTWKNGRKILESEEIDLLILDIGLPEKDGIEILKELRDFGYIIPVIIVTAYGTKEKIIQASEYDISDFVVKPFKVPTLREKIYGILEIEPDK
ncbi:MAG: response regulator [Fibrobacterota bacterium]